MEISTPEGMLSKSIRAVLFTCFVSEEHQVEILQDIAEEIQIRIHNRKVDVDSKRQCGGNGV